MSNTAVHDIFLRALAVAADQKKNKGRATDDDPKWPDHALVFDTETRITADQSLTFGVYRLCALVNGGYAVTEEGIFYADDLPAKDRKVIEDYLRTAVSDVASFPPRFPLFSRSDFIKRVFWPAVKYNGALVVGFNLPFDLARPMKSCRVAACACRTRGREACDVEPQIAARVRAGHVAAIAVAQGTVRPRGYPREDRVYSGGLRLSRGGARLPAAGWRCGRATPARRSGDAESRQRH